MEDLGFIILRHINNSITSQYWRECVKCIRKFYNNKIIVIDDNSPIISDLKSQEKEFNNILIEKSEIHGCGEVYGYYYAWKYNPFKRFFVLHDSMFFNNKMDETKLNNVKTVKFLWHFDKYLSPSPLLNTNNDNNLRFIKYCNCDSDNSDKINEVIELYYNNQKWVGCFGVASFIHLDFLNQIFDVFGFEKSIQNVNCRNHREGMERVFALLCFMLDETLLANPSLFGNILTDYRNAYFMKWNNYISLAPEYKNYTIIKIWSGR